MKWGNTDIIGPRHHFREILLLRYLRDFEGGYVLDAGCGGGSLSIRLAKMGFKVEAVDRSFGFAQIVRRKIERAQLAGNVNVQVGDLTALAYPEGTFDAAVCGEVLEHITDDEKAVKELLRVLKQNGLCVVTVPADPKLWTICDEWAGHKRRYTKSELVSLFSRSGFNIRVVWQWGFPILLLYERLLYPRYAKRMMARGESRMETYGWVDVANRLTSILNIMSIIFYIDLLFARIERGPSLLLVARKPHES